MERLKHPAAALAMGLVAFPVAKLLWVPNYVFNFLTTLVHEIGHALFAWAMGMPSIPTVSVAGGGVTVWGQQMILLCVAIMAAMAYLVWHFRARRTVAIPIGAALLLYPFLAFTSVKHLLPTAGGIALELGGSAACFFAVLGLPLRRAFERPLYALWGWWMLLNRGWETVLMLDRPAYRQSQAVINSGLAAGMTSDLELLRQRLGGGAEAILWGVLALCVLVLPAAGLAAWLKKRLHEDA